MEAFLTTLPPYVHAFLNKHPPTDVFNLLRELICFAVLYSEDRERINQVTHELLEKRNEQSADEEEKEENEAVVPNSGTMQPIQEEQHEPEPISEPEKPKLPNTFPEWWGHREYEPPKQPEKKPVELPTKSASPEPSIHHINRASPSPPPQSYPTTWVSFDAPSTTHDDPHFFRLERARSQIIPHLREYPEQKSPPVRAGTVSGTSSKRHSMINPKTSTSSSVQPTSPRPAKASPSAVAKKALHRASTAVCESPVSTSASDKPKSSPPVTRSASLALKTPRPNAAMRARAEHAKQQQEELERKKNAPVAGAAIGAKLKQRVNSGIDWDTIKRGRRQTIAEQPNSAAQKK
ncbi:hypothetical protein EDC96DRAFT_515885 [Choanephora cucurbitarum]|nr:hypothetical protein EDC96DRAFT_515885 [Choanephora cucurbitarum]